MTIPAATFRETLGHYPTGVAVVTAIAEDGRPAGMVVGSFTSVWDIVFGTAYMPRRDEWPDTGIEEHDEAKTVREFLFRPFSKIFGKRQNLVNSPRQHS